MATQMTCWTAQLYDGTKFRGGQSQLFQNDVNVAAVPVELIKIFSIGHNTGAHTYHVPSLTWYKNGLPWPTRPDPMEYIMQDQTLLTVSMDANGGLVLSQV